MAPYWADMAVSPVSVIMAKLINDSYLSNFVITSKHNAMLFEK